MSNAIIMIVEDEAVIARDLKLLLEDMGFTVPTVAATADEAIAVATATRPDLALLDIHLADGFSGIAVAKRLRQDGDIPFVFLTAHADPATVASAQETNPYGYVLKPFNEREIAITVQLALAKSASDRELRASEHLFATTIRSIADGVIVTDRDKQVVLLNPCAEELTGWTSSEAVGRPLHEVFVLKHEPRADPRATARQSSAGHALDEQVLLVPRSGPPRPVENTITPIVDDYRVTQGTVVVFRDLTARKRAEDERHRLERKLFETQRLESLGVLTSGIAHDFNNILTGVQGYIELADDMLHPASETHELCQLALVGIRQAAALTGQMLAYAGKAHIIPGPVSLNDVVRGLVDLLRGTFARRATLDLQLDASLPPIQADETQMHQLVLNLLTNAVEALGDESGTLTVRTDVADLALEDARHMIFGEQIVAGTHVCLTVRDTGVGMDDETLERIFDPFFTTKFTGRGLGLAAVYGIVRRHHGAIQVTSTPGVGTAFAVYLPASQLSHPQETAPGVADGGKSTPADPENRRRRLLVIDDDPAVLDVTARLLEQLGFSVHTESDGTTGLGILADSNAQFDAVLLDLTLPGLSGAQLVRRIQRERPGLPIVMMSGYTAEDVAASETELGTLCFLQKPFTRQTLQTVLATALTGAGT
jgi:PAS domain S-box-containing protein